MVSLFFFFNLFIIASVLEFFENFFFVDFRDDFDVGDIIIQTNDLESLRS